MLSLRQYFLPSKPSTWFSDKYDSCSQLPPLAQISNTTSLSPLPPSTFCFSRRPVSSIIRSAGCSSPHTKEIVIDLPSAGRTNSGETRTDWLPALIQPVARLTPLPPYGYMLLGLHAAKAYWLVVVLSQPLGTGMSLLHSSKFSS